MRRYVPGWHGWQKAQGKDPGQSGAARSAGRGDIFPSCNLVVLRGKADRRYLGLEPGAKSFALSQVSSDYLLVELYNELCYGCLKEVASYNLLFQRINQEPFFKGRLKIIGLGVGSGYRSVNSFRKKHGVLFPLFADHGREVFNCMGRPELPVMYLLRHEKGNGFRIILVQAGHVGQVEQLMDLVRAHMATKLP